MKAKKNLSLNLTVVLLAVIFQQGCSQLAVRPESDTKIQTNQELIQEINELLTAGNQDNDPEDALDFNLVLPQGNKDINYRWHTEPSPKEYTGPAKTIAWIAVSVNHDNSYTVDIYNQDIVTICLSCDNKKSAEPKAESTVKRITQLGDF